MIKISCDEIIAKIQEQTGLAKQDIEQRIERKMDQLSGLISKEGAAHIIANELSVKLVETEKLSGGQFTIKNILPGMRSVDVVGRVVQVYETRNFNVNGREGKVANLLIGDETGNIRIVLWNDQVNSMQGIKEGNTVKIVNAYVKENNGRKELHLNTKSSFVINPPGVVVGETKQRQEAVRKYIRDLTEKDENVEILGTIVQVFNLRFFEICPNCNRRAKARGEDGFYCDEHARITPNYSYVMNLVLDDGTETIRAVLFRNQVERLLKKNEAEVLQFKDNIDAFDQVKSDMIGNMARFIGRVSKNELFDRLEFVGNLVFTDVNPEEEIKRLEKEALMKKNNENAPSQKSNSEEKIMSVDDL